MYFASQLEKSHHLLLEGLPIDQAITEEEHRPGCALASVHIAGELVVAVADETCRVGGPSIVKTIVEGARHVQD
jgi:hypothetical protein